MINIMLNPALNKACDFINESLRSKKLLICIGAFNVEYLGRSSSSLSQGERLLIVKEDGSVIIHRSYGYKPVNWQPPRCRIKCSLEVEKIIILSERRKPKEFLRIVFDTMHAVLSASLTDSGRFVMGPTEDILCEILFSHPEYIEQGLRLVSREKALASGVADFTGVDEKGNFVIVEVKRHVAGVDSVKQLDRYLRAQSKPLRGILCAPSITKTGRVILMKKNLSFRKLNIKALSELITLRTIEETLDKHFDGSP
jgi:RecB family endonuclease NucS